MTVAEPASPSREFLNLPGEMARRFRDMHWNSTALGAIETWDQSLVTTVSLMLHSAFPQFIAWGPERIFLYNDAYGPVLGRKHPAALGMRFEDVWSDIWSALLPIVERVDRGESSYFEDLPLLMNRKGFMEQTYFTFSYSPILDDHERVNGLSCSCVETTGRKQAESDLRKRSKQLESVINTMTEGVLFTDSRGQVYRMNDEALRLHEFANLEAMLGAISEYAQDFELRTPGGQPVPTDAWPVSRALRGERFVAQEFRVTNHRTRKTFFWSYGGSPVLDDDGRVAFVVLTIRDVTREREREFELRAASDLARLVIETLPQGIWRCTPDGAADYCTETFVHTTGFAREDLLGWGWTKLIHEEDVPTVLSEWERCRRAALPVSVRFRLRRRDGSYRWYLSLGNPFFDDKGEITHYFGTWTDIDDLERARESAQRANELKSAFLANMSHEIRTPLGAMMGFADLLVDPSLSEAERNQYVEILVRNGQQLSHVINDILDLSKVEAGELHYEWGPVDPGRVVTEVLELWRARADSAGLRLTLDLDGSLPDSVITDCARLKQVLINVIGNAIKFTAKGGVAVRAYADGKDLYFDVTDTGIGIAQENRARLFQVFSQGDVSMTRKFGGTGLGLALSRRLAVGLGGDVRLVRSEPGEGSTFRIGIKGR